MGTHLVHENNTNSRKNISSEERIISVLEQRISSLEKQLDEKQKIIETLLQRPSYESIIGSSPVIIDSTKKTLQHNKFNTNQSHESQRKTQKNKSNLNNNQEKRENTKSICIIGDSMINGVNPDDFKKEFKVKVRPHGGATSEDMLDYVKPTVRKKPDQIILHIGTNDVTNGVDTIINVKKLVNYIKEESPISSICISSLITRADRKGLDTKVMELNKKLDRFCDEQDVKFINNKNINAGHLSKKKLHLSQKGISLLQGV